jgi:hypothetical protein
MKANHNNGREVVFLSLLGLGCDSVGQHMPSMSKALGSILSSPPTKKTLRKKGHWEPALVAKQEEALQSAIFVNSAYEQRL